MKTNELYRGLAAAAVRGRAAREGKALPPELTETPLAELSEDAEDKLLDLGREWGVKLYRFKRGHEELPRVKLVLGYLRGIMPESILDVGSGRGVFLFPFLDAFPECRVTALDILPHRVEFLEDIHRGGVARLGVLNADICAMPIPEKSVDVVTLLEVLEHIGGEAVCHRHRAIQAGQQPGAYTSAHKARTHGAFREGRVREAPLFRGPGSSGAVCECGGMKWITELSNIRARPTWRAPACSRGMRT